MGWIFRDKSGAKGKWSGPTNYRLEKIETRRWFRRIVAKLKRERDDARSADL